MRVPGEEARVEWKKIGSFKEMTLASGQGRGLESCWKEKEARRSEFVKANGGQGT